MRYFFDFEFLEDGKTIEPISLGMVSQTGKELYIEFDYDEERVHAHPWLMEHVVPRLSWDKGLRFSREEAVASILRLIPPDSEKPIFWAYYADYDWVALCQLFGTMMDLPSHFPMFCMDLQQWWCQLGEPPGVKPPDPTAEHNALADAIWNQQLHAALAVEQRRQRRG